MSEDEGTLSYLEKKRVSYFGLLLVALGVLIGSIVLLPTYQALSNEYEHHRKYCYQGFWDECEEYQERNGALSESEVQDLIDRYHSYARWCLHLSLLSLLSGIWFVVTITKLTEQIKDRRRIDAGAVRVQELVNQGGLENLKLASKICLDHGLMHRRSIEVEIAKEEEKILDYAAAIERFTKFGLHEDAARVRRLQADMGSVKVAQKVVQGDEITKTDIRDSVISKSNIGAGGDDKFTKLDRLAEMKKEGLIDDDEFKQMKKEILG